LDTEVPVHFGCLCGVHADTAYVDGEVCGVRPATTSFAIIQKPPTGAMPPRWSSTCICQLRSGGDWSLIAVAAAHDLNQRDPCQLWRLLQLIEVAGSADAGSCGAAAG